MDIFNGTVDLVRIVFLLGVILAFLYKKYAGVTPGGIVVPGILVGILFTSFPAFLITIATTLLCWIVYKLFISKFALSSRWSSMACISLSVVFGLAIAAVVNALGFMNQETLLLSLIAPGLITVGMKKYGFVKAGTAALFAVSVTGMIGLLLANVIPYSLLTSLSVQLATYTPLTLTAPFIVLPVSLLVTAITYYKFGIRSGGYMIAPFLAAVLFASPIQALLIALCVVISYTVVKTVQKFTFIIGLERFVLSLFCGYFLVTTLDLLAATVGIDGYQPSPLIMIIAIAVLTNDLCLQPLKASFVKGIGPSMLIAYMARLAV